MGLGRIDSRVTVSSRWVRERLRRVRVRLTLLATVSLAVALAIAAAIMLFLLHQALLHSADDATSSRARQILTALDSDRIDGLDSSLLTASKDVDVIQIVDAHGVVRASNPLGRSTPLHSPLAAGEHRTIDDARLTPDGEKYRATVISAATPHDGVVTVEVGADEAPITRVVLTVTVLLCIVFPVILLLLACAAYYFVGRTLRSVEQVRTRVADISGGDLGRRIPVPPGGDEIATLAETMNDMLARIEAARQRQLQFVGDASHELRSPLMTLVGLLDLARTTATPPDVATIDTVLLPEALRLQQMVDDLLLLARADEGGVPLRIRDIDLSELVEAEVLRWETLGTHTVQTDIATVRMRGDQEKLSRALRNVADNAARHARSTISFSVKLDTARDVALITVDDDGPGIPVIERDRVFDRFVRLDTTRQRSSGGSGLGLAIVAEIVRAHHGRVHVGEGAWGGAAIVIELPTGADELPRSDNH